MAEIGAPGHWRRALSFPFRLGPAGTDWRDRPFFGLAVVNNLSGAGDAFVTVALAGSVFVSVSLHAARGRTALGLLCTVLPFAVVGPFVGPLIDRMRGGRRAILFLAAAGRVAACLMMAAWIHTLLLFPAAFFSLVCSKTHAVAKAALVPAVVDHNEDLVRANSRLAVGGSVITTIAAGLGGAVYRLFDSRVVLDLDVLVFAAAAFSSLYLLRGSRQPVGQRTDPFPPSVPPGPTTAAAVGPVGGLLRRPDRVDLPAPVRLAQIAMAGMRAVAGLLTALVVFGFRRDGAPVIWYGLVGLASVGGNFGGALLAPRLRDRVSERLLVGGAAVAIAATAIVVSFIRLEHRYPSALVLAFVVALGASVAKAAFDAIVQRDTPDRDRSRLFARFESIFQLVWVVGALIPTLIDTSLIVGFVLVAATVVVTSAVFVAGLTRPARSQPGSRPVTSVSGK
ncbi:MAG TPA: MFS transporter [Acidimicrobiales bacterium]|jgi:MFS family permease|nr:MFS transporter [Acidimicrobiales bacterium]